MIYKAKPGSHINDNDAKVCGVRLTAIEKKYGQITPEIVVQDAKPINSPLHKYFEWDNFKAAEAYRIEQAGYIIRSIEVITGDGDSIQVRAFHSIRIADEGEVGSEYHSLPVVMQNEKYRVEVVAQAKRELEAWRKKYKDLTELSKYFEALDTVKKEEKNA